MIKFRIVAAIQQSKLKKLALEMSSISVRK